MLMKVELTEKQKKFMESFLGRCVLVMLELMSATGAARQFFHGLPHCCDVFFCARAAAKILADMKKMFLVLVGTFAHDLLQEFDPPTAHFKYKRVILRKRRRKVNEDGTAVVAGDWMRELDPSAEVVTDRDIYVVKEGIRWTYPEYRGDFETMAQPRMLTALESGKYEDGTDLDPVSVCIAMGDLLQSGAFPFARPTSDLLLLEECVELAEKLRNGVAIDPLDAEDYLAYFKFWDNGQGAFFRGQERLMFAAVLKRYPEFEADLRARFNGFEWSAQDADKVAEQRKDWDFETYVRELRFAVPITAA